MQFDEFIDNANSTHHWKYDYSCIKEFSSIQKKYIIVCPIHGEFKQTLSSHLNGRGCHKCSKHISKGVLELLYFITHVLIEKYGSLPEIITNKSPTFFNNKQHLDIYIPSLNISFEYNGVYLHSDTFGKGDEYHQNKSN